jgi:predicted transcriptional regulator
MAMVRLMARTQTMVQLSDELLAELDAEAAERGVSRSAVIRDALEEHLEKRRQDVIGLAIAEGYRRIPPGEPDEWGDLEHLADISHREMSQRLDEEERAAGFDPW